MTVSHCPEPGVLDAAVQGQLDPAARAQLDRHLDGCPSCAELLAELVHVFGSMMPSVAAQPEDPTQPLSGDGPAHALPRGGASLGRFVLGRPLGAGGMGVVYEAHDPQLQRRVALKLLHTEASAEVIRAQLLREARALARLSHPNVVSVHEVGEAGGQVYVAMEFIEGQTLRQWLGGNPSQEDMLATFVQAGRGLEAAHAVDLVHRDFKPDNVLVGSDGRARVVDFGLARPLQGGPAHVQGGTSLTVSLGSTRPGSLVGTPAYMAPEQLRGEPADARSDQFAFCVALHEALAGVRPFAGDSIATLSTNVLAGRRVGAARLPARLRKVIDRGLQVDPRRRFTSMSDLLARLRPSSRRTEAIVGASALAAIAATALTWSAVRPSSAAEPLSPVLAAWSLPEPVEESEPPVETFKGGPCGRSSAALWNDARRGAVRAGIDARLFQRDTSANAVEALDRWVDKRTDAVHVACGEPSHVQRLVCLERLDLQFDALATALGDADEAAAVHAEQAAARLLDPGLCDQAVMFESVAAPPSDARAAANNARVRKMIARARALAWLGSGQAEDVARKAVSDAGDDAMLSGAAHGVLGEALWQRGKLGEAEAALREALSTAADFERGEARLLLLDVVAASQRRFAEVDEWSAAIRGRVDAGAGASLGRRLAMTLTRVDMARLRYTDARATVGGLLREMNRTLGETHVRLLEPLLLAAELELLAEEPEAAADHAKRARLIADMALPKGDLRDARLRAIEGRIALHDGDIDAALKLLEQSLKQSNHPRTAVEDDARIDVGIAKAQALIAGGRDAETIDAAFEDAWQVWPKRLGNARVRHAKASWLQQTGDRAAAVLGHIEGVGVAAVFCDGQDDPRLLEGLVALAHAQLGAEQLDEAEATIKQAVSILDASIDYGPLWAPVFTLRGELALARKQPEMALKAFDDAYVPMASTWRVGHPRIDANVLKRADVAWAAGQRDYAKRLYGNVWEDLDKRLGSEHEDVTRARTRAGK